MITFALAGLALFAALCIGAVLQRRQSYAVVFKGTGLPGGSDTFVNPRTGGSPFAVDDARNGDLTVTWRPDTEFPQAGIVAMVARDPAEGSDVGLIQRIPAITAASGEQLQGQCPACTSKL